MTAHMTTLTRTLSSWMLEQQHRVAEVEQHLVRVLKELGTRLLSGLASLAAPVDPARSSPVRVGRLPPIRVSARPRLPPCSVQSAFGAPPICAPLVGTASPRLMPSSNAVPAAGRLPLLPCWPCWARPTIHLSKPPRC